ncbi:helix-turn-helix transcriptional regulator [Burkholderia multivorans]|uniref:helix-turn-helix transcriptional regulator n=2 Tax=Burkholderia multivorans TaxID=87883 RepID=UPI002ED61FC6|nr:LuxR C-terminal-related transcriptional regulator [Burkholderia multivorans]
MHMELVPDRLASLVSSMGRSNFAQTLIGLFDPEFDIIHCAAYEREIGVGSPRITLAGARDQQRQASVPALIDEWVGKDFRVDPILSEIERHARSEPGVRYFNFHSTPAPSTALKEMLARYYEPMDIGEEATYVVRRGNRVLSLSLYRNHQSGSFHRSQREALGRLGTFLLSSAERHAQLAPHVAADDVSTGTGPLQSGDWSATRADKFAKLRSALLMEPCGLTLREAEICAYIVLGHTAMGISLILGISLNTVATHRKRAYAKLGLSSQTELFNVCLKHCI